MAGIHQMGVVLRGTTMNDEADEPLWYAADAGERQGPMTLRELRTVYGQGGFSPDIQVWRHGMQDWIPLRRLFAESEPNPPPLPRPAPPSPELRKAERPTITIVLAGVFGLIGVIFILLMLPSVWSGQPPEGPAGDFHRLFPALRALGVFTVPINLLINFGLLAGAVLAYLRKPIAPRLLKVSFAAAIVTGLFFSVVSYLVMTNSDAWQRIPEAHRMFMVLQVAFGSLIGVVVTGVLYWRVARKPWQ